VLLHPNRHPAASHIDTQIATSKRTTFSEKTKLIGCESLALNDLFVEELRGLVVDQFEAVESEFLKPESFVIICHISFDIGHFSFS
jgi:hypothetical protein